MKSILTIFILTVLSMHSNGQSVVASAGQSGSNSTMQASATVGEAIIGANASTDLSANQGFQQPLQSDISTSIYSPQGQLVDVVLSPNPVLESIKLSFSAEVADMQLVIYNSTGLLVRKYRYEGLRSTMEENVSELESGTYYLYMVDKLGRQLGSLPLVKI